MKHFVNKILKTKLKCRAGLSHPVYHHFSALLKLLKLNPDARYLQLQHYLRDWNSWADLSNLNVTPGQEATTKGDTSPSTCVSFTSSVSKRRHNLFSKRRLMVAWWADSSFYLCICCMYISSCFFPLCFQETLRVNWGMKPKGNMRMITKLEAVQ